MKLMGRTARELIDELRSVQANDKSLGQHFLHDEGVLNRTMELAQLSKSDKVLEVGPGPGVLTEKIINSGAELFAVEIDEGACEHLRSNFPKMNLIQGDVLKVDWPEVNKVVANIPYQISSPLIEKITRIPAIKTVVILVQEEFAQRLVVETVADRGSLGLCTALDWKSVMDRRVGSHCFIPAPKINSRLIMMERIEIPEGAKLAKMLIRQGFGQRRKKLRNTLAKAPKRINRINGWHSSAYRAAFESLDSSLLERRPEELDLADWLELVKRLTDFVQAMG